MVYITIDDFFREVSAYASISREEEKACAVQMQNGDMDAKERLIQSYLPMVAGYIRRAKPNLQTLGLVLYCRQALEKAVDTFNFLQDSETFSHRLSWHLRQAVTKYIAEHRAGAVIETDRT